MDHLEKHQTTPPTVEPPKGSLWIPALIMGLMFAAGFALWYLL